MGWGHVHPTAWVWRPEDNMRLGRRWFTSSCMGEPGMELMLSGLVVSVLTQWAVSPAPWIFVLPLTWWVTSDKSFSGSHLNILICKLQAIIFFFSCRHKNKVEPRVWSRYHNNRLTGYCGYISFLLLLSLCLLLPVKTIKDGEGASRWEIWIFQRNTRLCALVRSFRHKYYKVGLG